MDSKKFQLNFFIGALLIVLGLTVMLFWPFIVPLALAFMAAIVFRPVNRWLLRRWGDRRSLAALVTVLLVLVVIFVPLGILVHQITVESFSFLADVRSGKTDGLDILTTKVIQPIHDMFPSWNFDVHEYVSGIADSLTKNAGGIFSSASSIALNGFIAVFGLFYLLRDGRAFKKAIIELSPLVDKYDNEIIAKIERAVNSVFRGSMLTSLLKGVLAAVGFFAFGIPHAMLWGAVTAIVSLLPGIGAGLTLIPAVLYLLAIDQVGAAIGLGIWGAVVVGLVDNFVMPLIVGKGFTVHPLLVLLSVVGGLIFFGPIGLFLGPLVVALLSALVEIYKIIVIQDSKESGGYLR